MDERDDQQNPQRREAVDRVQRVARKMLNTTTFIGPRFWASFPPIGASTTIGIVKRLNDSPMSNVLAPRSLSSSDHTASNMPMVM